MVLDPARIQSFEMTINDAANLLSASNVLSAFGRIEGKTGVPPEHGASMRLEVSTNSSTFKGRDAPSPRATWCAKSQPSGVLAGL